MNLSDQIMTIVTDLLLDGHRYSYCIAQAALHVNLPYELVEEIYQNHLTTE